MASEPQQRPFRSPRRIVVAALAAWIGVVVVGAGSSVDDSLLGVDHLHVVWVIVLAISALLGLALLITLNPFSNEWSPPQGQRSMGLWGALLIAFVVVVVVVLRPELIDNLSDVQDQEVPAELTGTEESLDVESGDEPETVAQATDLLALLAAVGAAAGFWMLMKRRLSDHDETVADPVDEEFEADLIVALGQLATELDESPDPRQDVLRCYVVLESVLANHGSRRARAETPTEHLRRSLNALQVDATPLIRLGHLYEIARFSEEPISVAQQQEAADALAQTRSNLVARV